MKRFGAACLFALAVIFLAAGCNDYGNTFQANTGASLLSISPSIVNAGAPGFTLTVFGGGFVKGTVVQWNRNTIPTTLGYDSGGNVISVTATVGASLVAKTGTASINTLSPHSGSQQNGLSNSLTFIINPPANPLPVLTSIAPASASPGSAQLSLTLGGSSFIPSSDPTGGSLVNWNANGTQVTLAATSVTASQISATVPATLLASQTCALVSVYNPPAIATPSPSGVSNPYSGGGGTSQSTPGFAVSTDGTFISNCNALGKSPAAINAPALAVAEETPALGLDGRFVTYTATQNGRAQIFMRDTCAGASSAGASTNSACQPSTSLLSAAADGSAGNADSNTPSMSSDGRFLAFSSAATNLVANAPSGRQIYLRDTCAGATSACAPQTTLLSVDESGALAGNDNLLPSVSSSGRFVAFLSVTSSKYPAQQAGASNSGYRQVFVRDTCFGATAACTPKTSRISLVPGDTTSVPGKPAGPAISGSAKSVGIASNAVPTLFTNTIPVDDRVFLAITGQTQK
jgi:hypothetical protein